MIKKRKNMQFFAAAAITAALVTGQFSFATVMGDSSTGTVSVQKSSLIPDNVTVEQPVPLSDIALPASDYGTLSWVDPSSVPSTRVQTYDVVFRPYNTADLTRIAGWDGKSDVIYSSVTVVVSSFSKDEAEASEANEIPDNKETTEQNTEKDSTTEAEVMPEITENKSGETTEPAENTVIVDETENPEISEVPEDTESETTEEVKENTEATQTPEVTEVPDSITPAADETPDATVTPEADKENIFDGEDQNIVKDERSQTVEEEPSEEEKAQLAETNHTCNGISVSGINLPWYVQFRVASGDKYEFTNEADANVFKAYEFELWDLKNNTEYEIPDGEYLSVTVPVKAGYDYTIEHLLDSGAMETIVPSVVGSTMVFSTHSFSPFGIAGSKALVGEEIEDGSYSSGTTTSTAQATSAPTVAATSAAASGSNVTASASGTSVQSDTTKDQSGSSADTSSTDTSGNSVGAVSTGDSTPILPFVLLGAAAVVIIGVIIFLRKRK